MSILMATVRITVRQACYPIAGDSPATRGNSAATPLHCETRALIDIRLASLA
jgi:hypothetical protein